MTNNHDAFDDAFLTNDAPEMDAAGWLLVAVVGLFLACGIVVLLSFV